VVPVSVFPITQPRLRRCSRGPAPSPCRSAAWPSFTAAGHRSRTTQGKTHWPKKE